MRNYERCVLYQFQTDMDGDSIPKGGDVTVDLRFTVDS